MTTKRIVYPLDNGGVCVVMPVPQYLENHTIEDVAKKDVPIGKPYKIVELNEIPKMNIFRDAWEYEPFGVNLEKARNISHEIRRALRESEFAPLDEIIAKKIPGYDAKKIEAQRQEIRAKYDALQTTIDEALTVDELHILFAS